MPLELDALSARDRAIMDLALLLDPSLEETALSDDERATKDACEKSLHTFTLHAHKLIQPNVKFVDGSIVHCLCEHFQACAEEQILKLVVTVPPGVGKSTIGAVMLPSWAWAKWPWYKSIFASYAETFAHRDADFTKDIVTHEWFRKLWPRLKLKDKSKGCLRTTVGGHRVAGSPGGQGVGERAQLILCDDIHKPVEIYSDAARSMVHKYITETLAGRALDPVRTVRIIMMHRLHDDDAAGYALARDIGYEHLCIPHRWYPDRYFTGWEAAKAGEEKYPIVPTSLQIARPELQDERVGKPEGTPMWPERYGEAGVAALEEEFTAGGYGQLSQAPTAGVVGDMFNAETFRYFSVGVMSHRDETLPAVLLGTDDPLHAITAPKCPLALVQLFQTIDTALKITENAAYTAISTMGIAREIGDRGASARRWLLIFDVWRERLLVTEQWNAIKQFRAGRPTWNPETRTFSTPGVMRPWPRPLVFQAIEPKASGEGLLQQAEAEGKPLKRLQGPEFKGDKSQRAVPLSVLYSAGLVYHLRGARWLATYEDELIKFPAGKHKDQVDTTAYGAIIFNSDRLLAALLDAEPSILQMSRSDAALNGDGYVVVGEHRIPDPFDD